MGHHLARAVEKQIGRVGKPVTVRRKTGDLDPVTSTRPSTVELEVETVGMLRRNVLRSMKGDPLATAEAYYLVPAAPFADLFTPRDSDLVIDGALESLVLSVRVRERSGRPLAYEIYVSGVMV